MNVLRLLSGAAVCALVLILVPSIVQRPAEGQSTNEISATCIGTSGSIVCTPSGVIYIHQLQYNGGVPIKEIRGQIPNTSPMVALCGFDLIEWVAYSENGDIFWSFDDGRSWVSQGNLFDGAVPKEATSWGRIKSERR
jgi:hypothetical protein